MVTHAFQFRNGDHPRSRGEYRRSLRELNLAAGSSPLSRGIRGADALQKPLVRIIPALAGNTGCSCPSRVRRSGSSPLSRGIRLRRRHQLQDDADHPRSRGEYQPRNHEPDGGLGIIPALAGNTSHDHRYRNHHRDHPRSRGEYCDRDLGVRADTGSSPLSRGIPGRANLALHRRGIIPALAGNTEKGSDQ